MKWILRLLIPALLGLVIGYGIHRYRGGNIENEFLPYQVDEIKVVTNDPRTQYKAAYQIAKSLSQDYGEIESYRPYQFDWSIRSTGLKPLALELVSATCEVEIDGKATTATTIQPDREAVVRLRWADSGETRKFRHGARFKTNSDFGNQEFELDVYGTVNALILLQPTKLDFGVVAEGEPVKRSSRLACFSTKSFEIESYSFSPESSAANYQVAITPVEASQPIDGRTPAVVYQVEVTALPATNRPTGPEVLELQPNLEGVTALRIQLKRE